MPTFVEFFAGGGLARLGLGAGWECVLANDVCAKKAATYRANFGADHLKVQDVRTLGSTDLPAAELWWASFPCQDHSSAGSRAGFAGHRGSLVFEITRLLEAALMAGTAPALVALENVTGFVRANDGRDFTSVVTALVSAGYRVGALMMDARDFVPQARERMILVAVLGETSPAGNLAGASHDPRWRTRSLVEAVAGLPPSVRKRWVWWHLPTPAPHGIQLGDMLDAPGGADQRWLPSAKVTEMLTKVTGRDAVRLDDARRAGRPFAATTSGTRRDTVASAWERDGRLVVRKAGAFDYGVELGAPADAVRLQVRLVGAARPAAPRNARRDADQETIWCSEFDRLRENLAAEGSELQIERALQPGEQPVRTVAMPSAALPEVTAHALSAGSRSR